MEKASKNTTTFLQLNQWIGEDYPERVDFVGDNKKVDDFAIKTNQEISNLKSEKSNSVDVARELDKKADKTYVDKNIPKKVTDLEDGIEYAKKSDVNDLVDTTNINKQIKELKDTKADKGYVDSELKNKSQVGHVHDERYSLKSHIHTNYAPVTHDHDKSYSKLGHNHDDKYAITIHTHDDLYSRLNHTHSQYSLTSHNHDTRYAPIVHNHDTRYAALNHKHKWSEIEDKPNTFSPSTHYHSEYATNKDMQEVFQLGVESNKLLVDALNSFEVNASTSDGVLTNSKKFSQVPKHTHNSVEYLTKDNQVFDIKKGYHKSGKVKANISNLYPKNIKIGQDVGGVVGNYVPTYDSDYTTLNYKGKTHFSGTSDFPQVILKYNISEGYSKIPSYEQKPEVVGFMFNHFINIERYQGSGDIIIDIYINGVKQKETSQRITGSFIDVNMQSMSFHKIINNMGMGQYSGVVNRHNDNVNSYLSYLGAMSGVTNYGSGEIKDIEIRITKQGYGEIKVTTGDNGYIIPMYNVSGNKKR